MQEQIDATRQMRTGQNSLVLWGNESVELDSFYEVAHGINGFFGLTND